MVDQHTTRGSADVDELSPPRRKDEQTRIKLKSIIVNEDGTRSRRQDKAGDHLSMGTATEFGAFGKETFDRSLEFEKT